MGSGGMAYCSSADCGVGVMGICVCDDGSSIFVTGGGVMEACI